MKNNKISKTAKRLMRHKRVRAEISGTKDRPRLCVFKSLKNIFAQIIDDESGKTLVSVHSKSLKKIEAGERKSKVAVGYAVGKALAEKAKEKGINSVVFDRGGYKYHGRVSAVAEGAREAGLKF